ncbi:MCP methylation inhibitor CheC [Methanocaldococcus villosus KIN24-T80]|uniref:MCP methylation inhibitor CheC n=1 Tax=Methanocaldococcus villosus KIN24-T80 TaxID=1069083 RepID=N6VSS3_9EURY|nr:chemotaxis protein CheC [Methanocaldococcus villosus]ENN96251.1 MCP methylation inhibitor CheC [Methanocaldococcus villosus KIN24-T80]
MRFGNVEISPKSWDIIVKAIIESTLGDSKMSANALTTLDPRYFKKIEDIGKFASEKAMRFITDMTGYSAELKVFNIRLITPPEIISEYGDEIKIFTKINFSGEISGTGVLIFSEKGALEISKAMLLGMGMECDNDEMDDMKISAINEICNILISAYVDSFANFMDTTLTMTPPEFITGMGGEILNKIFKDNNIKDDDIIMAFKSTMHICEVGESFEVLIVLPNESVDKLFKAITEGKVKDKLSVKFES